MRAEESSGPGAGLTRGAALRVGGVGVFDGASAGTGSRSTKREPWPLPPLEASTLPPCSTARWRTIDRPTPRLPGADPPGRRIPSKILQQVLGHAAARVAHRDA